MNPHLKHLRHAFLTALAVGGIVLLNGCGNMNQSPLSSGAAVVPQSGGAASSGAGTFTLTFSPNATGQIRASKPGGPSGKAGSGNTAVSSDVLHYASASGKFTTDKGGKLEVNIPDYSKGKDSGVDVQVDKVKFTVKGHSIDQDAEITMQVQSGSTMKDIVISFTPTGLKFSPPAKLEIYLSGTVDSKNLDCYHMHDGELVSSFAPNVKKERANWKVTIDVPGFSSYSLGGDDGIPAPEVPGPNGP